MHGRLKQIREERRISASDLAKQVGVSRGTIYAIEAGSFIPNTTVSLQLARALQVTVEDIFSLAERVPHTADAELLAEVASPSEPQLVQVYGNGRKLAIPAHSSLNFLPPASGIASPGGRGKASVTALPASSQVQRSNFSPLLLAGCDPALSLLTGSAPLPGFEIVPVAASSRQALLLLSEGKVQIAGLHLFDRASHEYNLRAVRASFPGGGMAVLTFAHWEIGIVTQPGNPLNIRSVADLGAGDISIANRQKGSGARDRLDSALKSARISPSQVPGYNRVVYGHLPAAFAVRNGWAHCCIASRSAARCFGLAFVPLEVERFDLVCSDKLLRSKQGQAVGELLNAGSLRERLQTLAGYDSAHTGERVI